MAPAPILTQQPQILTPDTQEINSGPLSSLFPAVKGKTKKGGKMTDE